MLSPHRWRLALVAATALVTLASPPRLSAAHDRLPLADQASPSPVAEHGVPLPGGPLLYLPYPAGRRWQAGGPHGRSSARNAIDFGINGRRVTVTAAADGTVASITNCGGGWLIFIEHVGGYRTGYLHLSGYPSSLKAGDAVKAGQRIGTTGRGCGAATFDHVHLSLWRHGSPVSFHGVSIGGYTAHQQGPNYCGYWTRDRDGTRVLGPLCLATMGLTNDQVTPGDDPAPCSGPQAGCLRLAGANRYATAAEVSKEHHPVEADTVFIATGENFPDALTGAAVAGMLRAPLLLASSVPPATSTELGRLDPDQVVILGGTAVVDEATEADLAAFGTITRLAGANRYATAVEISQFSFADGSADVVVVATGENFPDALAGASAAVALNGPVLLIRPDSLPSFVTAEIERLDPGQILLLGGTAAVNQEVEDALAAIAPTTRLAGANRFTTAVEISKHAFADPAAVDRVYVAVGTNFPDALAGAAAAGANGAPVLLTPTDSLPSAVADEITRLDPTTIVILGGTTVISQAVEDALAGLLGP